MVYWKFHPSSLPICSLFSYLSLVLTEEKYTVIKDPEIFARWASSWGLVMGEPGVTITVRLKFSKAVTFMICEAVWHPSQHLELLEDGGCVLTVTVNHTLGIKLWARTFGPDVEVLEPETLRLEVAREAYWQQKLYSQLNLGDASTKEEGHYPL